MLSSILQAVKRKSWGVHLLYDTARSTAVTTSECLAMLSSANYNA